VEKIKVHNGKAIAGRIFSRSLKRKTIPVQTRLIKMIDKYNLLLVAATYTDPSEHSTGKKKILRHITLKNNGSIAYFGNNKVNNGAVKKNTTKTAADKGCAFCKILKI